MLTAQDLTQSRFTRTTERTAQSQGWGSTTGGQALLSRYLVDMTEMVSTKLTEARTAQGGAALRGKLRVLFDMDPTLLALVGLQAGISSVAGSEPLTRSLIALGNGVASEAYALALRAWDEKRAIRLSENARKAGARTDRRLKSVKQAAKSLGFTFEEWDDTDHLLAGKWLLDAMLETPVFSLIDMAPDKYGHIVPSLTLTEEAMAYALDIIDKVLQEHPMLLPVHEPIAPWVKKTAHMQGDQVILKKYSFILFVFHLISI